MKKFISHTDLDGHGVAVIARAIYKKDVDITYCEVDESDNYIQKFFSSGDWEKYDHIYITDIPMNESTAQIVDDAIAASPNGTKVNYIDHHVTALYLNQYKWAKVETKDAKGLCSATSLFYDNISSIDETVRSSYSLGLFAELVRRWDTWEWKTIYNDIEPKQLNDLLHVYGPKRFEEITVYNLVEDLPIIGLDSCMILKIEEERNTKYISNKKKEVIKYKFRGFTLGIVFADRCISELGNAICEQDSEIDVSVMIDPSRSISFRTTKDIDCSKIAKIFKGGGHRAAAGCSIPKKIDMFIIDKIFKEGRIKKCLTFLKQLLRPKRK